MSNCCSSDSNIAAGVEEVKHHNHHKHKHKHKDDGDEIKDIAHNMKKQKEVEHKIIHG
jgi:hypothetical protein